MTKPYGWGRFMWRDEDYGPPSKYVGGRLRSRGRLRQLLHKLGRRRSQRDIDEQIQDMEAEDTFVCSRCGKASPESDRSPGTTECIYC